MHELSVITQVALDEMIAQHKRFIEARPNGKKLVLRHCDLTGLDISNRDLSDAELLNCDFSRANLTNSKLERARLNCSIFRSASLSRANLSKSDLRGCVLASADLSMANLRCADLREENTTQSSNAESTLKYGDAARPTDANLTNFNGADMENSRMGSIIAYGASFQHASLKGAGFAKAQLKNCDFTGANLAGADMNGAMLEGAIFHEAILTSTVFGSSRPKGDAIRGAVLNVEITHGVNMQDMIKALDKHQIWCKSEGESGEPTNFDDSDLRLISSEFKERKLTAFSAKNSIATGIVFMESELQGANFENADLRGASFVKTDLRGANFARAKLVKADFRQANLSPLKLPNGAMKNSDFRGADLRYSTFESANLLGANFEGADKSEASFKNSNIMPTGNLPKAFVA